MKKKVAIVGGGTAGMMLAAKLNPEIFDINIYDQKNTMGRKFLVAGDGGFNLTHRDPAAVFKSRYTPHTFMDNALDHFSNSDFREWLQDLGIPTFVGSSGRVFPEKNIKPIDVLKAIESHLKDRNVTFYGKYSFEGWDTMDHLIFNENEIITADFVVFALGGSSWKVTGSDGKWMDIFKEKNIEVSPFRSSNCAFELAWDADFLEKNEGKPLKNIHISIGDTIQKGEAVITKYGIEGNAIYGLSPYIQAALASESTATVYIDFKPTMDVSLVIAKLETASTSITTAMKERVKLSNVAIALIKDRLTKEEYMDNPTLAQAIKQLPLHITAAAPIDEAISTSGGVSLEAITAHYELKDIKNHFCIGEMLDWDAPTGGYLIQACVSMGAYLAHLLNERGSDK